MSRSTLKPERQERCGCPRRVCLELELRHSERGPILDLTRRYRPLSVIVELCEPGYGTALRHCEHLRHQKILQRFDRGGERHYRIATWVAAEERDPCPLRERCARFLDRGGDLL